MVAILGGGKKKNIAICDNRLKVLLGGYGIDKKNLDLLLQKGYSQMSYINYKSAAQLQPS